MIGEQPTETNTRAYNANSVASVYISSGYGDLTNTTDPNLPSGALSLQNGIYGMSDPAGLNGLVERFEVELTQGGTSKGVYRLRIINPTDELEMFLFGIYNSVFPNENSAFDIFSEAADLNRQMTSVDPGASTALTDLIKRGTQLPFLYLRWGYGSDESQGLSRIHKCVLNSCEYTMNASQDKVIELHLIDWFGNMTENDTFNIRPYLSQENCLDDQKELKGFKLILTQIIRKYTTVFKGVRTFFDEKSTNMEKLEATVNQLAISRWEEWLVYSDEDAEGKPANFNASTTVEIAADLAINAYKPSPIGADLAEGRSFANGDKELSPANQIWLGAYHEVFEFLGITLRSSSEAAPVKPVSVQLGGTDAVRQPDVTATLGKAYAEAAKKIKIKVGTDPQLQGLQFQVPVWEAPSVGGSLTITDPLITNAFLAPLMPWETPRIINYNPSPLTTDFTIPPVVAGILAPALKSRPGLYSSLLPSQPGRIRENRLKPLTAENWEMDYSEFELLVVNAQKLRLALFEGKSIQANSPEAQLMPSVFIPKSLMEFSQYSYLYADINELETLDRSFLLYVSPNVVNRVKPPSFGAVNLSPGMFQRRGLDSIPLTYVKVYDPNIFNFNIGKENLKAFIRLMPSLSTITKLESKLHSLQKQIQSDYISGFGEQHFKLGAAVAIVEPPSAAEIFKDREKALRAITNPSYDHTVEVFLGTGNSTSPHITQVLRSVINGINKLVIGETSPFVIQQLDLNSLTPENLTKVFGNTGVLGSLSPVEKEYVEKNKPMILMIGPDSWLEDSFSKTILAPVRSFPEITRTNPGYENNIFLTYGQKDSIVTDLNFKGDIRVLYNIPQAFYATLQHNSLKNFFETATDESLNKLLKDLMVFVFENAMKQNFADMDARLAVADEEGAKLIRGEKGVAKEKIQQLKNLEVLEYTSYQSFLEQFPETITDYTDEEMIAGGFTDVLAARKITSVLGTEEFVDLLFPVVDENPLAAEFAFPTPTVVERQLDVASFYKDLAGMEAAAMDAKMNYIKTAQNESWKLEISTLGIPELDVMGAEFYARKVIFTAAPPRTGSRMSGDAPHWLTGIYQITGIRHELQPATGFITHLSLVKLNRSMTAAATINAS